MNPATNNNIHHTVRSTLPYEIRHPLTNIILATEMLESKLENDDLALLEVIKRNSIRINTMLNECINQHPEWRPSFNQSEILSGISTQAK